MYDNRGAAMFEQEMRDRLAAATADINQLREQLAAMTQRAVAAEAKLAHALGADKPDKPATPTERARHWAIVASEEKRRAEQAEARVLELLHANAGVAWVGAGWLEELTETQADLDRCVNLLLTVQHINTVPDMNRLAKAIHDVKQRIAQRKEAQP